MVKLINEKVLKFVKQRPKDKDLIYLKMVSYYKASKGANIAESIPL